MRSSERIKAPDSKTCHGRGLGDILLSKLYQTSDKCLHVITFKSYTHILNFPDIENIKGASLLSTYE